jgi:hypothetical protein
MSFLGFDVMTSDGASRHYLTAYNAKECARTLVKEGRVKWATVRSCEDGLSILDCGDPDATEEVACTDRLRNFCIALSEAPDLHPQQLKLLEVRDATAGTCYVRFGSMPRISGSRKLEEGVDVTLQLAPGNLEDWMAGRVSLQTVCRGAQVSGALAFDLCPYATSLDNQPAAELAGKTATPGSTVKDGDSSVEVVIAKIWKMQHRRFDSARSDNVPALQGRMDSFSTRDDRGEYEIEGTH